MGASNIYQKLKAAIGNDYGVFGLMGNLKAESNLRADNLQNTYSKKFGMTDEEYTKSVDNGSYTNFVKDSAGYGLAQWTYWSRKQKLLQYAQAYGCSIGDENMQVDFMIGELMASYPSVLNVLKTATSIRETSDCVLTQYERPADQSESVKEKRAAYGEDLMKQLLGSNTTTEGKEEVTMGYTNSPLVSYTKLSPNHSGQRTHAIDRITPHCVVGQCSIETLGNIFAPTSRQASCQYGIGVDGRVGMYCEEKNRSWCSSSSANDQRAITIECASDTTAPYAFKDVVYNKLIELCVDICKRNGKTKLLWLGDKDKTLAYNPAADEMVLTVHRWFANKSCPGDWMYQRMGDLAAKVTAKLGGTTTIEPEKPASNGTLYRVQVGAYSKKENANNQLKAVKAKGFDAFITQVDGLYKVQVGAYSVKANAEAQLAKVKAAGFDAFITTKAGTAASTPVVESLKVGDKVKLQKGAPCYGKSTGFQSWVYDSTLYVREINGSRVVISTLQSGAVTGAVDKKYLTKI